MGSSENKTSFVLLSCLKQDFRLSPVVVWNKTGLFLHGWVRPAFLPLLGMAWAVYGAGRLMCIIVGQHHFWSFVVSIKLELKLCCFFILGGISLWFLREIYSCFPSSGKTSESCLGWEFMLRGNAGRHGMELNQDVNVLFCCVISGRRARHPLLSKAVQFMLWAGLVCRLRLQ